MKFVLKGKLEIFMVTEVVIIFIHPRLPSKNFHLSEFPQLGKARNGNYTLPRLEPPLISLIANTLGGLTDGSNNRV